MNERAKKLTKLFAAGTLLALFAGGCARAQQPEPPPVHLGNPSLSTPAGVPAEQINIKLPTASSTPAAEIPTLVPPQANPFLWECLPYQQALTENNAIGDSTAPDKYGLPPIIILRAGDIQGQLMSAPDATAVAKDTKTTEEWAAKISSVLSDYLKNNFINNLEHPEFNNAIKNPVILWYIFPGTWPTSYNRESEPFASGVLLDAEKSQVAAYAFMSKDHSSSPFLKVPENGEVFFEPDVMVLEGSSTLAKTTLSETQEHGYNPQASVEKIELCDTPSGPKTGLTIKREIRSIELVWDWLTQDWKEPKDTFFFD